MRVLMAAVGAAALCVGSAAFGQREAAQGALDAAREASGAPGMAAAVWAGDGIAWTGVAGSADLEHSVAVTDATRFRLGSVCKVFTASLAARLAAEGRIDLDKPLREWMANLPEHYEGVTLRHLLGHLGGVRHYERKDFDRFAPGGPIDVRWYPTVEAALGLFVNDPLTAAPGEKYAYSTFGYTLASAAMEEATGESFEALLRVEVFEPLALATVAVDEFRAIVPNRAAAYDAPIAQLGEEAGTVRNAMPLNSAYKVAAGGLVASARDVAAFGAAHFDAAFLGEEMFAQVFTAQTNAAGEATGVGLGWRIGEDASGRRIYHHAGSQQGCRAVVVVWPAARVSVAVLGNLTGEPREIEKVAQEIAAGWLAGLPAPVGGD